MSQMTGQIGPIRMHKKPTEANIRKAAKIKGMTAAAFMRWASEGAADLVITLDASEKANSGRWHD